MKKFTSTREECRGVVRKWNYDGYENIFPLVNNEFTMVIRIKYQESLEYTKRLEYVRKMSNRNIIEGY